MDEDPISYLRRLFDDETYQSVRNLLGKYGLEGHAHTIPMRDLSGGQKARIVLAELSLLAPHLLFLDEPTNNLDIETIDALCARSTSTTAAIICVTHDARLIAATEMRLWVVADQDVQEWKGTFDSYRQDLLEKLEAAMASNEAKTAAGVSVDAGGNRWELARRARAGSRALARAGMLLDPPCVAVGLRREDLDRRGPLLRQLRAGSARAPHAGRPRHQQQRRPSSTKSSSGQPARRSAPRAGRT